MNKVSLTLSFEADKLEAMDVFLKKNGSSVQKKMEEALKKLYEEAVPEPVREFVDAKAGRKDRGRKRPGPPTNARSAGVFLCKDRGR